MRFLSRRLLLLAAPVTLTAGCLLTGRGPFPGPPAVPACAEPAVDTAGWARVESPGRAASFRVPPGFELRHPRGFHLWVGPPERTDGGGWTLELTLEPRFRPPQTLGSAPLRDMHGFERRPTQRSECTLAVAGRTVRAATYIERRGATPYMGTAMVHLDDRREVLWLVAYGRRPNTQAGFLALLRTLRFGAE